MGNLGWAFLAAAIVLGACDPAGEDDDYTANLRKWQAARPLGYEYLYRRDCFCPVETTGPFIVSAASDSVLRVQRITPDTDTVEVKDNLQTYSIGNIFIDLRTNLDRHADHDYVRYDADYGFPDSVFFDFEKQAADEEYGFVVKMLRVVAKDSYQTAW
jgi:hypothetical protein